MLELELAAVLAGDNHGRLNVDLLVLLHLTQRIVGLVGRVAPVVGHDKQTILTFVGHETPLPLFIRPSG